MDKEQIAYLAKKAQEGDENALGELIKACYSEIYYFALKMVKSEDVAEDIIQEVFISIFKDIKTLKQPTSFITWAKAITYHQCASYLKKKKEVLVEPDEDGNTVFDTLEEENVDLIPHNALDRTSDKEIVKKVLSDMPREQSLVTTMYYLDGKGEGKIAEELGITKEKVTEYLQSAKEAFENAVNGSERKIYDVYISYCQKDVSVAKKLTALLKERNVSVKIAEDMDIAQAISASRIFVPIISEASINSKSFKNELFYAFDTARKRSKSVMPIYLSSEITKVKSDINLFLAIYQRIIINDCDDKDIIDAADRISLVVNEKDTDNVLFSKLSEYISAGLNFNATQVLCEIIEKHCVRMQKKANAENFFTLITYLEKMSELYDFNYSPEARELAHKKLKAISCVSKLRESDALKTGDLYFTAVAIRLIYLEREISYDCADAITGGDVSDGIVPAFPEEQYALKQEAYVNKYRELLSGDISKFTESQMQFIRATEQYIYKQREKKAKETADTKQVQGDEELLRSVASFTREGNKLFDIISEKQPARDFLKCLITSYERLKNYCDVVGAKEICAECIDRIEELKYKLDKTDYESKAADKSENGIKTLLGITSGKSGDYDVFLSHKSEDFDIALQMYEFLRENLKEPFFDRNSLPEMGESKYRKAIMQALDKSKHFVVVISDLSYLESYWVALEMEIFQSEIDEGRKKGSNFIMIVTNDVYDQIVSSNKAVLPIDYRRCEIIKVDEYKSVLLDYLNK